MTEKTRPRAIHGMPVSLHDYTTGTSNDTVKAQAWLDAAAGSEAWAPPGDYYCDALAPSSNTRIYGPGRFISRTAGQDLFAATNKTGITFDRVKMLGKASADVGQAAALSGHNAIKLTSCTDIVLRDLKISRFLFNPLQAFGCTGIHIWGGKFTANAYGPWFSGCRRIFADKTVLDGSCLFAASPTAQQFAVGWRLDSTDGHAYGVCGEAVFSDLHVRNFGYSQAFLAHAGFDFKVLGFSAINSTIGISVNPFNASDTIDNFVIDDAVLTGPSTVVTYPGSEDEAGIFVAGGGSTPIIGGGVVKNSAIAGFNTVRPHAQLGGVVVGDTRACTFSGLVVQSCGANAMVLKSTEEAIGVNDNTFRSVVAAAGVQRGLFVVAQPSSGTIVGNRFRNINGGSGKGIKGDISLMIHNSTNNFSAVDTSIEA